MKFTTVAAVAASISAVSATPLISRTGYPKPGHEYVAPKKGDSRGPCPALNAMANHGFLPHNGRDITIAKYVAANLESMNVGPSFSLPQSELALQSNCTTALSMDLEQLGHHDVLIEHDASLAHQDQYFGKDYTINQRSLNMFIGGFHGAKQTSLKSAAATKYGRVMDSLKNNPKVTYGARVLGRSLISGVAPTKYVKVLFGEERLPYAEGWTPGPRVNEASLGAMAVLLQPLAPAPGDEETYVVTKGAIQEIIEGKSIMLQQGKAALCNRLGS